MTTLHTLTCHDLSDGSTRHVALDQSSRDAVVSALLVALTYARMASDADRVEALLSVLYLLRSSREPEVVRPDLLDGDADLIAEVAELRDVADAPGLSSEQEDRVRGLHRTLVNDGRWGSATVSVLLDDLRDAVA